ncbi:MAG: EamA family transporter [Anaerolineales bacterium]|nr:EamA family transporter [Anaerolineales bacterium]
MNLRGYWFVFLAAVLWGTNGTAQAFAPPEAKPIVIGAARMVIGGLGLLAVALTRRSLGGGKSWPFWPTLFAALSMAAYQLFFFAGVSRTGVAVGTIVGIGSSPILGGVVGFLVRGERPSRRWGAATLLGILGSTLLILAGNLPGKETNNIPIDLLGIALATCAGLSYAIFTTASKGLLEKHPPEAVMAVAFCAGALLLLPILFLNDSRWLAQPRGLAVALHLGLVSAALGYTLFARGLRLVPVATAATLTLGEPLTAGLLGFLLLREPITPLAGAGILLIFAGLVVLSAERG